MERQQPHELAEVIDAWFDLPRPIILAILAMIRVLRQGGEYPNSDM